MINMGNRRKRFNRGRSAKPSVRGGGRPERIATEGAGSLLLARHSAHCSGPPSVRTCRFMLSQTRRNPRRFAGAPSNNQEVDD